MGIEIKSAPNGVQPGSVTKFIFTGKVQAFALGLGAFKLTYGNSSNSVQNFSIKLLPIQTEDAAVTGNVVSVQVNAELQDASGHTVDVADSLIYPVCVAMVDTFDPKTLLTNVTGIADASSDPVQLPGSSGFSALASFLSGFAFNYSEGDHVFMGASAGCGINNNQSEGRVNGYASLYDGHGNNATSSVDAGVIASTEPKPGFAIEQVNNQTEVNIQVKFPSLTSIGQVFCLLSSWQVQYDGGYSLETISAGVFGVPTFNGNTVTLPNLYARVNDSSGNNQNDTKSSATALVIALP